MIRSQAIKICAKMTGINPIISANGFISRDLFTELDKPTNFYMIGSMGLASSIGLGIALKNPGKKIFVFDGDGNILMNMGSLATIGALRPRNLIHIVFDNHSHESTGGQPTISNNIKLEKIAESVNYKVFHANTKNEIENIFKKIKSVYGPIMIIIKIKKSKNTSKRVGIDSTEIKNRFMNSIN